METRGEQNRLTPLQNQRAVLVPERALTGWHVSCAMNLRDRSKIVQIGLDKFSRAHWFHGRGRP